MRFLPAFAPARATSKRPPATAPRARAAPADRGGRYRVRPLRTCALLLGLVLAATARPAGGSPVEGEALLRGLGCPACHVDLGVETDIRRKAPPLDDAGLRWEAGWLFDYLGSPRTVRRHVAPARMPDFRLTEAEAVALTSYLVAQVRSPILPTLPRALDDPLPADERISSAEEFVRLVGSGGSCLTCHVHDGRGGVLGPDLGGAGARLRRGWLLRFLAAPQAWDVPDGVMPALFLRPGADGRLRPVEDGSLRALRRIVDHLRRAGAGERRRRTRVWEEARGRHPSIGEEEGRTLFDALACRACHRLGDERPVEPAPDLRVEGARVRIEWLRDYLAAPHAVRPFGARPGNGSRMPDFRLTDAEIDALVARLGDAEAPARPASPPLSEHQRAKARALLAEELACLGCHRLDGAGGRVGPDLGNASTRLRADFVRRMIADPAATVPHQTMPRLPLGEETRELVARFVLEPRPYVATTPLSPLDAPLVPLPSAPGPERDYALYCAPCHGADGRGKGFNAPFLPVAPTAHADASLLGRRADDTLFDGIHAGAAVLDGSHFMPAWGETLSADRIAGLVAHLRTLCACEGPAWSRPPAQGAVSAEEPPLATAPAPEAPATAPEEKRPDPSFDDFVGAEACAECHAQAYDVWRRSTHGRAGGIPGEAEVVAAFDGRPRPFRDGVVRAVRTRDGRLVFRVRQQGRPPVELEVAAVVGGGHLVGGGTQTFFTEVADGTLRMLPFDFHRGEDTWFVQRRGDARWTRIGPHVGLSELEHWPPYRALGSAPRLSHCENCHGSQLRVEYDRDAGTWETRWKSLRIDCESCHGPGRTHVGWARAPDRDRRADLGLDTLVVLDKEDSIRVCLRCHANKQVLDPDYLPGADLDRHLALKLPMLAQDPYLVDGRIDGFGYQQNHLFSDCFVEGSMVCTDCHDPHAQTYRDVHGRPLDGRFDDGQCTGCHASKAREPSTHTHHAKDSPGSRCVACHMPYLQHQAIGDELRFARSDHTIPIPRPAFDASIGIDGACSKCHPDRAIPDLQADVDAWWGPVKPHPAMIRRVLAAGATTDDDAAAALLLAPGEKHTIAQLAGLADFVRRFARTDARLGDDAVSRLTTLAGARDPDVAAVAVTALDVAAPDDPRAAARLAEARTTPGDRGDAIRGRWRWALVDLSRLRRRDGDGAEAARLWERVRALAKETPAPEARRAEGVDAPAPQD